MVCEKCREWEQKYERLESRYRELIDVNSDQLTRITQGLMLIESQGKMLDRLRDHSRKQATILTRRGAQGISVFVPPTVKKCDCPSVDGVIVHKDGCIR